MGIICASIYDASLGDLTNKRTMASLPFGGRYRQIDFTLSNMTNSGISRVGIISKHNYQSLMGHIGSGQSWDLELGESLDFLTPFATGSASKYRGKLDALNDYKDLRAFSRKCIINTANAGKFSSDRTIRQYADEIWHIKELPHHDGIKLW